MPNDHKGSILRRRYGFKFRPPFPGVAVAGVMGGSPAAKAGLQAGDVIQRVDGKPVSQPAEVATIVRAAGPGHAVSLSVWSNGNSRLVPVQVGQAPAAD